MIFWIPILTIYLADVLLVVLVFGFSKKVPEEKLRVESDFSIFNTPTTFFMIFRAIFPLMAFLLGCNYLWVFIIYGITRILDSFDDDVIAFSFKEEITFESGWLKLKAYHIVDKSVDSMNMIIFVIWSYFYMFEFFNILLVLTIYRMVGVISMVFTSSSDYLVFFPNTCNNLFTVILIFRTFFENIYWYFANDIVALFILLICVIIYSITVEIVFHYIKPDLLMKIKVFDYNV